MNKPKVTLLSHTGLPLETVMSLWNASKDELPLMTPQQIKDTVDPEEVRKLFRSVIDQHIPVGESVDFVFMIEGISVSWREQAVRHRIGVKPSPERLGVDIGMVDVQTIPDLADSVWWSQSMRIQSMGKFADQGNYRIPEAIEQHKDSEKLLLGYNALMKDIQAGYNKLVAAGIPMEDARELIPLGATHRISWKLNISSLQHIVSKRGCWILQLGIWGPVIQGMIRELTTKVDPIFGELVTPPCLKGDEFTGCIYHEENRRRYTGDDCHAPCPLHVVHHHLADRHPDLSLVERCQRADGGDLSGEGVPMINEMRARAEDYHDFWNRDPYSGKRLLPVLP
jgi:thymidylate synthase (FAD)